MDYKSRMGLGGGLSQGGGVALQNTAVGGNVGFSTSASGNATGPALVLVGIVVLLVADYVWTRGQQGGR